MFSCCWTSFWINRWVEGNLRHPYGVTVTVCPHPSVLYCIVFRHRSLFVLSFQMFNQLHQRQPETDTGTPTHPLDRSSKIKTNLYHRVSPIVFVTFLSPTTKSKRDIALVSVRASVRFDVSGHYLKSFSFYWLQTLHVCLLSEYS